MVKHQQNMGKLKQYLKDRIFPIQHTGLGHTDLEVQPFQRASREISYKCSLCETIIKPKDWMEIETQRGVLVERQQPDFMGKPQPIIRPWEVLGFVCHDCNQAISDADQEDNISYG